MLVCVVLGCPDGNGPWLCEAAGKHGSIVGSIEEEVVPSMGELGALVHRVTTCSPCTCSYR